MRPILISLSSDAAAAAAERAAVKATSGEEFSVYESETDDAWAELKGQRGLSGTSLMCLIGTSEKEAEPKPGIRCNIEQEAAACL